MQSNYTFGNNVPQVVNVTLCGVPAPILTWSFNDGNLKVASRIKKNSSVYEYEIQLPQLKQETCGRELMLNATGFETIKRSRRVYLTYCKYWEIIFVLYYSFNI